MAADLFDRKSLISIVPADIVFNKEDRGIFLNGIVDVCKKTAGMFQKLLVEFSKRKSFFNGIQNISVAAPYGELQLSGGILQTAEKLIIKIPCLIWKRRGILIIMPVQQIQKSKSFRLFFGGQKGEKVSFGIVRKWFFYVFRKRVVRNGKKRTCRKKVAVLEKDHSGSIGAENLCHTDDGFSSGNIKFRINSILFPENFPGKLSAYSTIALVDGTITGALDETFTAGDLGEYTITEADDGGTEIVLGAPLEFNPENIEEMAKLY